MRNDFQRMDTLFKRRPEFVDYMAKQQRSRRLREYDARIEALQNARAHLEKSGLYKLSKGELKSAEAFCLANGWTKEDAAFFVEDFQSRCPPTEKKDQQLDKKSVASGVSSLASALFNS